MPEREAQERSTSLRTVIAVLLASVLAFAAMGYVALRPDPDALKVVAPVDVASPPLAQKLASVPPVVGVEEAEDAVVPRLAPRALNAARRVADRYARLYVRHTTGPMTEQDNEDLRALVSEEVAQLLFAQPPRPTPSRAGRAQPNRLEVTPEGSVLAGYRVESQAGEWPFSFVLSYSNGAWVVSDVTPQAD